MSEAYRCNTCGETFADSEVKIILLGEYDYEEICPCCGSVDIEEEWEC